MSYDDKLIWKNGKRTAPFDKATGSLQDYPHIWAKPKDYEVREALPFTATLKLIDFSRGRSAATFWWEDVDHPGRQYPMFMSGALKLIQAGKAGSVSGEWKIVKRGGNYGIEAVA
jgi:hypothetical protein